MYRPLLSVILLLGLSPAAPARDLHLAGTLIASDATPVSSAVVTLVRAGTGWKRAVLSNQAGAFSFTGLAPGAYRLEAVKPGFRPVIRPLVHITSGDTIPLRLQMADVPSPPIATVQAASDILPSLAFPAYWP